MDIFIIQHKNGSCYLKQNPTHTKVFVPLFLLFLRVDKSVMNVEVLKQAGGYYSSTGNYYHKCICYSFYDVSKDCRNTKNFLYTKATNKFMAFVYLIFYY